LTPSIIVLACVLRTIEYGPPTDARCHTPQVRELVSAFEKYGERYDVPAHIEAAKCYHESGFDKHARGTHGEIGLCQPKPHGAIQGRDLKLSVRQLEDIDTNVRISTQYIAQFVHQCEHPSGWLTKYNRPKNGCRTSIYSTGVLTDLRRARDLGRQIDRPATASLGSGSPYPSLGRSRHPSEASGSTWAEQLPLDRISRTGEGSDPSTPPDTDRRRPSGTRHATQTEHRPAPSEAELAVPFQEPR
jgi:hypothetical protein